MRLLLLLLRLLLILLLLLLLLCNCYKAPVCNSWVFFLFQLLLCIFFPSGQPIRRVLHSGTIGTTALAICFPKLRLYILTHTNYDRLKAFVKQQTTNFNQKRAENPFVKEVQTPVHETVNSEGAC